MAAFRRAAELEPGPEGARLLAWAARAAGAGAEAEALRAAALARDAALGESLRRAVDAAAEDEDPEAEAEAAALLAAIAPGDGRRAAPAAADRQRTGCSATATSSPASSSPRSTAAIRRVPAGIVSVAAVAAAGTAPIALRRPAASSA